MEAAIKITGGMVLSLGQQAVTELSADQPAMIDAIWGLDAGDHLESLATMYGKDHPFELVFTAGKRYQILDIRPLRTPPTAVVIDDSGSENNIDATFLQNFKHFKK